jgi:hyaluronan synthase
MNEIQAGAIDEKDISYPFAGYSEKYRFDWRDFFYRSAIIGSGFLLIFFIILLKSKTTAEFALEPVFFSYAIFVTTFELSRIISAMLYESSMKSLLDEKYSSNKLYSSDYEPTVAFVIPCKNEENDIGDAVIQCYQVNYPREKIEVIVINDGSTDRTKLVLDELKKFYPTLKVIDWPNQGKRWAMAAGFKTSTAEIIIQLDSDSCVDPSTFREWIEPFRNPKIAAVCAHGVPKNADVNVITRMQTAYYFMSFRILKAAESTFNTVFCLSGCGSAYRKKAVMPIIYSWLSESFLGRPTTYGDDRALTSWLLKQGEYIVYNHKAIAYTVVPSTVKQLFKQQLRWKKSWIINAILTSEFIWKKQPFVSFFYYFPLVAISFLTPIMTFRALIYTPFTKGIWPLYHVAGVILVTALITIYYRYLDRKNKYWPYLFLWSIMNLFFMSFVLFWAAIKIQDRGWGTR